jgi:predicted unusual protein kinase regulating ubiquinone biosynthesis (AarF/ABC1/UbiB family)
MNKNRHDAPVHDDSGSRAARVRRYARVSSTIVGLGARFASERYLGLPVDHARYAAELVARLGDMKGPVVKIAQLLATIPGALPREYAWQLASLQANAPPMGWHFVRRRMAGELGPDWMARFRSFERQAARAASLGQVHRAIAADGRVLACKLQYPAMNEAVEADLKQLELVLRLYDRYEQAVNTQPIYAEIADRVREELDYLREAGHIRLYRLMFAASPDVVVPEWVPGLSTRRLLSMTWLEGTSLLNAARGAQEVRDEIARRIFHAWYLPFYHYGAIHGDPHLGNYTLTSANRLNLLDFGCVRIFSPDFVKAVIDLYYALERGDEALAVAAYRGWGFGSLDRTTIRVLDRWARLFYAPLLEDRARHIQEGGEGFGLKLIGEVHNELRRLGGVTPPREFVLMERAAIALGSVFVHLQARLNWHLLFHELIDGFDTEILAARQRATLAKAGLLAYPYAGDAAG